MDELMRSRIKEVVQPLRNHAFHAGDQAYNTIATVIEHAVMMAYDGLSAHIVANKEPQKDKAK